MRKLTGRGTTDQQATRVLAVGGARDAITPAPNPPWHPASFGLKYLLDTFFEVRFALRHTVGELRSVILHGPRARLRCMFCPDAVKYAPISAVANAAKALPDTR